MKLCTWCKKEQIEDDINCCASCVEENKKKENNAPRTTQFLATKPSWSRKDFKHKVDDKKPFQ